MAKHIERIAPKFPDKALSWQQPCEVEVEVDRSGTVQVWSELFLQYGVGSTFEDACADFAASVAEEYRALCRYEQSLAGYLPTVLYQMRQYIKERKTARK